MDEDRRELNAWIKMFEKQAVDAEIRARQVLGINSQI